MIRSCGCLRFSQTSHFDPRPAEMAPRIGWDYVQNGRASFELAVARELLGCLAMPHMEHSAANEGLACAIRASLIRQLLDDIEIVCEAAPEDDLRFLCVSLRIWRQLRRRRATVAAVLPSFVVTLNKLACLLRVPGDCEAVVRRYLARMSQRSPVDGCEQM
jgi:hypothetical protein